MQTICIKNKRMENMRETENLLGFSYSWCCLDPAWAACLPADLNCLATYNQTICNKFSLLLHFLLLLLLLFLLYSLLWKQYEKEEKLKLESQKVIKIWENWKEKKENEIKFYLFLLSFIKQILLTIGHCNENRKIKKNLRFCFKCYCSCNQYFRIKNKIKT